MIDSLHNKYVCVSPVYRGGKLYKIGDILLVPKDVGFSSKNFECVADSEEKPQQEEKPKRKKKMTSEEEV